MGTPEPLTLKRGRNTLELKPLVGLARIKKFIFVPSAQAMPDDLENGRLPSGSIVVDSRNLVDWKSGRVINSLKRKNVVCRITALYPEKVEYHNDNPMIREEIIRHIVQASGEDPIVSTTGKASFKCNMTCFTTHYLYNGYPFM